MRILCGRFTTSMLLGGGGHAGSLPFITGRIGFRTKLLREEEALRKIKAGEAMGRAVMMLDAPEQVSSSPLFTMYSRGSAVVIS